MKDNTHNAQKRKRVDGIKSMPENRVTYPFHGVIYDVTIVLMVLFKII